MADIIIVEDDDEIGNILQDFLTAEGYDVYHALTGEEGLEVYLTESAKLILLDIMLPGLDGFAVCSKIREDGNNTPILMVSARVEKEDQLNGLLLGADDYIEKPYDIDILLAKIKGIFQRRYSEPELRTGEIVLDKVTRQVTVDGREVETSVKEYELLMYLMENKDRVLKKEELFHKIWGFESESEQQTLTVHIKRLREKIEAEPKNPKHILTVWGVGYRFV